MGIVVVNARHIKFSGNKEKDKLYTWHTGYPGGVKTITPVRLREDRPEEVTIRCLLQFSFNMICRYLEERCMECCQRTDFVGNWRGS